MQTRFSGVYAGLKYFCKNEKKAFIVDSKSILTARTNKLVVLNWF